MDRFLIGISASIAMTIISCGEPDTPATGNETPASENPLSMRSTLPFQAPPFDKLKDSGLPPGDRSRHGEAA